MTTQEGLVACGSLDVATDSGVRPKRPPRSLRPLQKSRVTPVLYMLSPQKYMSPFDINMAIDSGYKVILPYDNVTLEDVKILVQDAVFSRPPQNCPKTGFFIGGKDIGLALEMMTTATNAMVPPFQVSVFADPGGSFTTAASMVACVERVLRRSYQRSLRDLRVAVFGATGVVGLASAVLAALEGAQVRAVTHQNIGPLSNLTAVARARFGVRLEPVAARTEAAKAKIIRDSDVVLCAAAAGVRVISRKQITRAPSLMVVADVNAVAPTGVEGMESHMDGVPLSGSSALAIGPLTIGDVKYKTQASLFQNMLKTSKPLNLDFRDAFVVARRLTAAWQTPERATQDRAQLAL
jgi:methylene-tetrahydromethanopterin dehydrogenase